jgi:di/tricarboxylate transporter
VYKAINWQVIFLIAGAISMGTAMESTGTAKLRQNNYLDYLEIGPDCIVVYTLFFKFLNGNYNKQCYCRASAPIAISTADTLGLMFLFASFCSLFKFF